MDFIYSIDSRTDKKFKRVFKMDKPIQHRQRLGRIYIRMKEDNPFASISNKGAQLLSSLKQSIQTNNVAMADSILMRLTDEIAMLENDAIIQSKKTHRSYLLTVISTVLTIIFGLIGLVPLIKDYLQ